MGTKLMSFLSFKRNLFSIKNTLFLLVVVFSLFSSVKAQTVLSVVVGNRSATLKGVVDVSKYSEVQIKEATAVLYVVAAEEGRAPYQEGNFDTKQLYEASSVHPVKVHPSGYTPASSEITKGGDVGINTKTGEYFFTLKNLDPNTLYYYAQELIIGGKVELRAGSFNSEKGNMAAAEVASDFEKRSYRLLSPLPGLSVLLDPDLCEQYLAENKPVPSLCTKEDPSGFNGFLNYAFRLLIGISAVLLVLRIIFEGYQYAVSDVPFLKASAKSKLGQSFAGLALALSAWLILNTINPLLVENRVGLRGVTFTIEENLALSFAGIDPNSSYAQALDPAQIQTYKIGRAHV